MSALLLVIDLQKGWLHKTATTPTLIKAAKLCHDFDGDVIHCRFRNDPQSLFFSQLHWTRFSQPFDTDVIDEVADLHLPHYWRSNYSCVNDETRPTISKYDRVYIAGVYTDISVYVTALDIFDLNVPVYVVSDCVATLHGDKAHEWALRSLEFAIDARFVLPASEVPQK